MAANPAPESCSVHAAPIVQELSIGSGPFSVNNPRSMLQSALLAGLCPQQTRWIAPVGPASGFAAKLYVACVVPLSVGAPVQTKSAKAPAAPTSSPHRDDDAKSRMRFVAARPVPVNTASHATPEVHAGAAMSAPLIVNVPASTLASALNNAALPQHIFHVPDGPAVAVPKLYVVVVAELPLA